MKTLTRVIAIVCVMHVLAGAGVVGWAAGTGRLSRDRVQRAAELFTTTLDQERAAEDTRAAAEADALKHTERVMALADKAEGVGSADERVEDERRQQEMTLRKLERTKADVEALQRNLQLAAMRVQNDQQALIERHTALEQRLKELEERSNDEGFKKAVAMYESLPAKQTKQMFIDLIDAGNVEQVVSYLEAMQPRKAAGVLKEFKSPAEVGHAVELTERLRTRGSDLVKAVEATG